MTRLNSELGPGLKAGESELTVKVEEASPVHVFVEFNNFQSPTVGAERGVATLVHRNVLGYADTFFLSYGQSEGVDGLVDVSYSLPFTPWDTTMSASFRNNNFDVIEAPFDELEINSETNVYSGTLRQPVYRARGPRPRPPRSARPREPGAK